MYVEALNEAIREEMENDEAVYYMGEDVRASIYGASKDLFNKFGEDRVLDTPLSAVSYTHLTLPTTPYV